MLIESVFPTTSNPKWQSKTKQKKIVSFVNNRANRWLFTSFFFLQATIFLIIKQQSHLLFDLWFYQPLIVWFTIFIWRRNSCIFRICKFWTYLLNHLTVCFGFLVFSLLNVILTVEPILRITTIIIIISWLLVLYIHFFLSFEWACLECWDTVPIYVYIYNCLDFGPMHNV